MARKTRQKSASNDKTLDQALEERFADHPQAEPERDESEIEARTQAQGQYIEAIRSNQLIFGVGPAGTGKTFIASALASDALMDKRVRKLIVTRPAIEAGESLGFLPGSLNEKFDPFFWPVREVLCRRMGSSFVDYLIRRKQIEVMPLAYMRGVTFRECFVIFDEAQNATSSQMKMFLTRIGEHSKIVVNGDLHQSDLPGVNGLHDAVRRLQKLKNVRTVQFNHNDVVRSGMAARIVEAYEGM